jgi:hypothetical protein
MFDQKRYFRRMQPWILTSLSLIAMAFALSACAVAIRTKATVRAECATASARILQMERSERLTPSKLAELAEFKDAIEKADALLVRISQREVMRQRREQNTSTDTTSDKDALRRRAGIVPGRPAPHQ